ncbi:TPA: PspA/IM30 family protein [Bacillus thuringiensis]|uniref:Phage shock protein A n=3 Tax=Bacillus cereus group TaxID=86661 RepID=A0A9X6Q8L4_BACTU|nr:MULTISPECIES: PspA/IM30 family protein [Bacillus cereus group]AGE76651.1 PspA/IM30 [Bacillus thuringiensis serovar kurstaki str. HD73]AHZ49813.1 phage shock protein A, PspA [Bacillus thuringiensis serovar kurstaki str. YBT-1520]AIE32186.1 phage shock protein A, PspA [Bacillus thuringiensis serovar kurstaki str. HD-1]AIM33605.1 PspA/IM30 [Bacillus thuringiensis serovar kurstaki str. YBT-1520]AJA18437.1 phage-shock protein [Bacillus thuringiensis serovar galleriae]
MGILKRIKNIVVADVHQTLDKIENPISMLKQYLRETEQQITKAEKALSHQYYLEKKYEALISETNALIAKRTRQAELAVSREEDHMAQLALQEKIVNEKKAELYRQQYEITKEQTATLYEQIDKLQKKYGELQYKELVLVSRLNAAQAIKESNRAIDSFHTESTAKGFARIESYVQKLEAETAASNYFYNMKSPNQQEVLDKNLQEEVQRELEKLKENK